MQVKITYKDGDNAIFTGVSKIVEKDDGYGAVDAAIIYQLRDDNGNLLFSVSKVSVKDVSLML